MMQTAPKPQSKYDLMLEKRHYPTMFNHPTVDREVELFPVGQWPVIDHTRERAHYPNQWNRQTEAMDSWRPSGRRKTPNHSSPRVSRVRIVKPVTHPDLGDFPQKQMHHFSQHLARTTNFQDLALDRKIRSEPAGCPDMEWTVETAMTRKIQVLPSHRRNFIREGYLGDKMYGKVETSDRFYNLGSTIAHSDFGKIAGGHSGEYRRVKRGAKMETGISSRADDFGRQQMPARLRNKVQLANNKPYHELLRDLAKTEEIRSVTELPDDEFFAGNSGLSDSDSGADGATPRSPGGGGGGGSKTSNRNKGKK